MCEPCYDVHDCASLPVPLPQLAQNLQCSQCFTEPAVFLCICNYPCQVFCRECYSKHSSGLPIHFNLPVECRNSLNSRADFEVYKARYADMQRLYSDMTTANAQIADFRRAFERKVADVMEKVAEIRGKMNVEIEKAQKDLQEQEACLKNCFTDILISAETRPNSEICRLIDSNYPKLPAFEHFLDFSPVLLSLDQVASFHSPLLSQLRPQLPVQASLSQLRPQHPVQASLSQIRPQLPVQPSLSQLRPQLPVPVPVPSQRQCSNCEKSFSSAPLADITPMRNLHSDLWTDFCSFACLEQFKKVYLELAKP